MKFGSCSQMRTNWPKASLMNTLKKPKQPDVKYLPPMAM